MGVGERSPGRVVTAALRAVLAAATASSASGYDAADRRTLLLTAAIERVVWRPTQAFLGSYGVLDYVR